MSPGNFSRMPCRAPTDFSIGSTIATYRKLAFKAFSLQFEGPSGPIILWVVCFLAFIAALRLLQKGKP